MRSVLEFAEATGACSEGLPLSVKELMAHLHGNDNCVNANSRIKNMSKLPSETPFRIGKQTTYVKQPGLRLISCNKNTTKV